MDIYFWVEVIAIALFILVPIMLFIELYVGHMEFPGLFEKCGLKRREVGLLIVGASVSMVSDVPIIIYGGSFLAINFGGAIIPMVLAVYFVKEKKLNLPLVVGGVAFISFITWYRDFITKFDPTIGVFSEFPYYFIPPFIAMVLALLVYRRDVTKGIPFAYAICTLGVLIGADIVRIPMILSGMEEVRVTSGDPFAGGSIGGAGIIDLVYLSGLMAIAPMFLFAPSSLKKSRKEVSPAEAFKRQIKSMLKLSERLYIEKRYKEALDTAIEALDMKIRDTGDKFGIRQEPYVILDMLQAHPYLRNDYWLLRNAKNSQEITQIDVLRGINTAKLLVKKMAQIEGRKYADIGQRVGAFIIDLVVLVIFFVFLIVAGLIVMAFEDLESYVVWIFVVILWAWAAQTIYFTFTEWRWGQSLGKRVMKIRVVNDEQRPCTFMDAFTRNVVRFLDIILLFYLISLIFMAFYPKRQRIGDMIAKTVVIKV